MTGMSDELLARIGKRAADPNRRYMTAAEDQSRVELPVEEIDRRFDDWHAKNEKRAHEAALRDGMTPEEYAKNAQDNAKTQAGQPSAFDLMMTQMRAWGRTPPDKLSFVETDGHIGASTEPPGARPLAAAPTPSDWSELERIAGRPIPADLKRLYSIADGGFGPGFTGLHPVHRVASCCEDFRRRGPDYCGTIAYPECFMPIAGEMLDYHYDLDTGRIISSNQDWVNDELEPEDIYDIAFQNLAAMMEDWLSRS